MNTCRLIIHFLMKISSVYIMMARQKVTETKAKRKEEKGWKTGKEGVEKRGGQFFRPGMPAWMKTHILEIICSNDRKVAICQVLFKINFDAVDNKYDSASFPCKVF